jgi:hypothetical protein
MLSAGDTMRQAMMTANDYLIEARHILSEKVGECDDTDAIELCKVMAQDYHTMMMCNQFEEFNKQLEFLVLGVERLCNSECCLDGEEEE